MTGAGLGRDARGPGLALAIAGVVLFGAGVLLWFSPVWDGALYRALRLDGEIWPARIGRITRMGGFAVLGPVALIVVVALWLRGKRGAALWLAVTIASGRIAIELLKLAVHRARPPEAGWWVRVDSWSFPSSHTAGTMLTCVALALLARRRAPWLSAAIAAGVLIGWSRVALGVHWPSDVLAGWGFGLFWAGAALGLAGGNINARHPLR